MKRNRIINEVQNFPESGWHSGQRTRVSSGALWIRLHLRVDSFTTNRELRVYPALLNN